MSGLDVQMTQPAAMHTDIFTRMFNGKPSYRFELKEDDNTLSGYAKGETKGRAEFSYCYATSDDFKGLPADVYQKAQITKTVYHHGKGICPQGASRDYEFSVYIPSSLGSDVSTIFAQWHGMPDRTLVQTPQGEVKKLTIDEFVELEKTTIFKKNEGHEKVAKLDKQGNPVKDKHFAPFGFQVQTFLNTVGRNRCIFVIGIRITEPVDMISLCLKFLSF